MYRVGFLPCNATVAESTKVKQSNLKRKPPCSENKLFIISYITYPCCTQWYLYYNNRFKFIIHNFISTKKMKIYIFAQFQPTSERAREPQNILGS